MHQFQFQKICTDWQVHENQKYAHTEVLLKFLKSIYITFTFKFDSGIAIQI